MRKKIAFFLIFLVQIVFAISAQFSSAEELSFATLLPPAPAQKAIENTQYFFEGIKDRKDMKAFFFDIQKAKQDLYTKIKPLTRFHARLPCSLSAEPQSIFELSLPQMARIYLIFDALENGNLVKQIAQIINNYKEGNFYEPGGLGLLKNGQILLEAIPSSIIEERDGAEASYILPFSDFARPHIFTFHMHPLGKSGPAPGPSYKVEIDNDAKEAKFGHDIGMALFRAKNHGDYHHLLISKMYSRYFNVDYYFAQKLPEPPSYDPSDYCGKLIGFRIVDLGVWSY
ncbi:MAG: hypothetical protein A2Y98_01795 [Candidatus Portnoybacteria bacterium RBG_19FT_COMBO_36_7]|uniref:Uncharacterized protein n=1 Tax=Candidatus Portnoybacteria bacterium RBG_19FT_COMBO_36_7 TaxID=1801992 RepID=A0A1G2F6E2_9BACT|nr:MAG: hypothetical protein A2Y98_01795 [Candidatus Portnoybacteria bacterium RBG_19FT_COMBO_36_7]